MRTWELTRDILILDPSLGLPVRVDAEEDIEVSVVHDDSGDYLNIGLKGGDVHGD